MSVWGLMQRSEVIFRYYFLGNINFFSFSFLLFKDRDSHCPGACRLGEAGWPACPRDPPSFTSPVLELQLQLPNQALFLMCSSSLPSCMYMYYVCAWYPQRPEEGIRSPVIGVINGYKPPCRYWDLNVGLL